MNKPLIFLLLVFLSACYTDNNISVSERPEINEIICDSLLISIENTYRNDSKKELVDFLDNWNKSVIYKKESSLESELERDIYNIYNELFKPNFINTVCKDYFKNTFYDNLKYYIIQPKVRYHIEQEITEEIDVDSLPVVWDFRPQLKFDNAKVLYLTSNYEKTLIEFLKEEHTKTGDGNLMNPSQAKDESYKRYKFLNSHLQIQHGHWGNYWHFATHPEIEIISFDANRETAIVGYRIEYSFWDAEFIKENDSWSIVSIESRGYE